MRPSARRSNAAYDTDLIVPRMSAYSTTYVCCGKKQMLAGARREPPEAFQAMPTPLKGETRACQVTRVLVDSASVQRVQRVQRVSVASPNS